MLITTARHEREIAAKDAEIGAAKAGESAWFERWAQDRRLFNKKLRDAEQHIEELSARLAPFIADRERDAKGHFLPTKGREA